MDEGLKPQRPETPPPQPMLRIGGDGHPTLSEMEARYNELYKGTLSYQAEALRKSLIVLGKEIVGAFLTVIRAIAEWLEYHPILARITHFLAEPPFDDTELVDYYDDDILRRYDGEILVIEDAPPVEFLGKRKNG